MIMNGIGSFWADCEPLPEPGPGRSWRTWVSLFASYEDYDDGGVVVFDGPIVIGDQRTAIKECERAFAHKLRAALEAP